MRKREPEVASGSAKVSRSAWSSFEREKLAAQVEKLALEAFRSYEQSLKKLAELRPLIALLREAFMKLQPGEKIAGCKTWTDFCERVLHRTDRRIRQILSGANPASGKHSRKSLQAKKGLSAVPEPKTVEVPGPQRRMDARDGRRHFVRLRLLSLSESEIAASRAQRSCRAAYRQAWA